jgi:cell division septum initiation protein DivIVA
VHFVQVLFSPIEVRIMKLTAIQSAVVASGILLAGSLASSPVLAQSGSEKGQAERMREMQQVQDEQARERAREQQERMRMREQGEANADAANQNRKADPANKGSDQGQAQKQEKSRAWWNFWGD